MRPTLLLLALLPSAAQAQWTLQQSNTTASLRGIHAVTPEVAWASGTSGTVLHTTDGGAHWLPCATPPAAEHLDFRGVQAFDAHTAIVMSSGKGDLSRLYKTTDACQTWTLVFTNPDPQGFWDAISFGPLSMPSPLNAGFVIGDPVGGSFALFETNNLGDSWHRWINPQPSLTHCKRSEAAARPDEALFAASNSSLLSFFGSNFLFTTGGKSGARLMYVDSTSLSGDRDGDVPCKTTFGSVELPFAKGSSSGGAFGFAVRQQLSYFPFQLMVVGGDYSKPDDTSGTAVFLHTTNGSHRFFTTAATTPPHGYRSSVAYNPTQKSWITVGPNGTDLSTDDGRNWHPLRPAPTDAPGADRDWNALSLPFVVGPHGRIGRLNPSTKP